MLRFKLFACFIGCAFIALFDPKNGKQIFDDHIAKDEERVKKRVLDALRSNQTQPQEAAR